MGDAGTSMLSTHPLLGRVGLDDRPAEMHFEGTVAGTSPSMRDHRIFGRAVLSAAAMVEVALAAAEQLAGRAESAQMSVRFHDVLSVADEGSVVVRVRVRRGQQGSVGFVIESGADSTLETRSWRKHAEGEVRLVSGGTREGEARSGDTAPTMERESGEAFYSRCADGPFQWGESHRVVGEVYRSPTETAYRLRMAPQPERGVARWPAVPLLDGCLQVPAMALSGRSGTAVYVPALVERVVLQRVCPAALTVQWVHCGEPAAATSERGATLSAFDRSGIEVVRFEGVRFRSITRAAFIHTLEAREASVNRAGEEHDRRPATAPGSSGLRERLAALPRSQRLTLLTEFIGRNVAELLKLEDPGPAALQRGFFSIGLDSLLAIELQFRIQQALDFTLPPSTGLTFETPEALARYLLTEVLSTDGASGTAQE